MQSAKRITYALSSVAAIVALATIFAWQPILSRLRSEQSPSTTITVALSSNYPGSGLLYLAAAKGFYAQEGLNVNMQPYSSGRDALDAAIEKRADLGTAGDVPIMFAAMDGRPVAIVATIFTAAGAHGIVARRDRRISTPADLKNKVVGVTRRTDGDFVLSTTAARYRISLDELRIEPVKPEEMAEAIKTGKVDAVSTWEPWLTDAIRVLGENSVEFRSQGSVAFEFSLAGNADWVRANPDKVQRLLRALLRAKSFSDENPIEARAIIVKATNIDPSLFDVVGPRYRFVVQLNQSILILLEDMARWAIQNKLTDRTVAPNFLSIISMDALTAVKPDAVTIVR